MVFEIPRWSFIRMSVKMRNCPFLQNKYSSFIMTHGPDSALKEYARLERCCSRHWRWRSSRSDRRLRAVVVTDVELRGPWTTVHRKIILTVHGCGVSILRLSVDLRWVVMGDVRYPLENRCMMIGRVSRSECRNGSAASHGC
jgi:hypothetical protein